MIQLTRGGDSLIVSPTHGGAIVGWTRDGIHLLRRPSPESVLRGEAGAMGCFPLVPYCNRIAHRHFTWDGQDYHLAGNFGDHPHAIHGVGWQTPWRVEAVAPDMVTLSSHHAPDPAWPFAFEAILTYQLTGQGLVMEIAATNRHAVPAPMGIGAHPYFPRATNAAVTFQSGGIWHNRDALPDRHDRIPAAWDHGAGRAVAVEPLDHCFTGWHGTARWPGMRLAADPVFGNLQVYTPADAAFFCVEPVSHVPNAVNMSDLPQGQVMTSLAPGATLRGAMTLMPDRS